MNNKEAVKQVYDEIHAPDALLGKVMKMDKKEFKMRNVMRYAAGVAAAFAVALVVSNGVCYAATGETWISKAIVYMNGEETEQDMTWHQEGDLVYGEIELPVKEGEDSQIEVVSFVTDGELPEQVYVMTDDTTTASDLPEEAASENTYTEDTFSTQLMEENGKIFLLAGEEKIDITEDFKDGEATGTFELEGVTIKYTVTGDPETCEISLACE